MTGKIRYLCIDKNADIPNKDYAAEKEKILHLFFSNGLCLGKAMVAYTKPQHRKKEEGEQLRG